MTLKNIVQKAILGTMIGATTITGLGMAREASAAEQTVPIGGVYVSGAQGSEWHDQQLFRDVSGNGVSGDLTCVERSSVNNDNPGFSLGESPSIPINIAAGATLVLNDVYEQIMGDAGACALWLVTDGEDKPIWRSRIFNQEGEAQNGMTIVASEPTYNETGSTLSEVLSATGMRDSAFLESGPEGVAGYWKYQNGAPGGNETFVDQNLGPNRTFQWTGGVQQLLGFEPEAGGQLDYIIEEGSANAYLSRTNNESNDGAFNGFEAYVQEVQELKIIGVDMDGDGIADVLDADGDNFLDSNIAISCGAPWPYEIQLIVEPEDNGQYNYNENPSTIPGGMDFSQASGLITYDAPCSDSGQNFLPQFTVTDGPNTSPWFNIHFMVED